MSNIIGFKPRDKNVYEEEKLINQIREMYAILISLDNVQMFKYINHHFLPDGDNPFIAWFETYTRTVYTNALNAFNADILLQYRDTSEVDFKGWLGEIAALAKEFFEWKENGPYASVYAVTVTMAGTRDTIQTIFQKADEGVCIRDIYIDDTGSIASIAMSSYCHTFDCTVADVYTNTVDESL